MSINYFNVPEENYGCIGNYKNKRREFFEKTIRAYIDLGGDLDIYISDVAYTNHKPACVLSGYFALRTNDKGKSHSPFWRFVERMEETK